MKNWDWGDKEAHCDQFIGEDHNTLNSEKNRAFYSEQSCFFTKLGRKIDQKVLKIANKEDILKVDLLELPNLLLGSTQTISDKKETSF